MPDTNKIQFIIEIDEHGQPIIRKIDEDFEKLDKSAKQTGSTFSNVANIYRTMIGVFGAYSLIKLAGEMIDLAEAASDVAETVSKSTTIFGEQERTIEAWAATSADAMGLSRQAALENAATLGNMFQQLGAGNDIAAENSKNMVQLAADLASFHNVAGGANEVLLAMQSSFRGEYDALQRYIPTINAAAVQQEALAMTGKDSAKQLTDLEKALAAVEIITNDAGAATGDFARTSEGAANQGRIFEAKMADLKAEIGERLLPVLGEAYQKANDFISSLNAEDIEFIADSLRLVADSFLAIGKAVISIPSLTLKIAGAMETEVTILTDANEVVKKNNEAWVHNAEALRRAAEAHEKWRLSQHEGAATGGLPGAGAEGGTITPPNPEEMFDFDLVNAELSEYQALMKEVNKAEQEFSDSKITSSGTFALMEEQLRRGIGTDLEMIDLSDQKKTAWQSEIDSMMALTESHSLVKDSIGQLIDADQAYLSMRGAVKNALVGAILGYESFGAAMKKAIAQMLAQIAAEAAIRAILHTAMGIAALTPWGAAAYGPASAQFQSAAMFAVIAAAAGAAASSLASTGGGGGGGVAVGPPGGGSAPGHAESLNNEVEKQRDYAQKWEVHINNPIGTGDYVENNIVPELRKIAKRDTEITVDFD